MTRTVLRIDSSARHEGSVSRQLADRVIERLGPDRVIVRDLAETPLPQVTGTWITAARSTPPDERSEAQLEETAQSDALIEEMRAADVLVIGLPMYNFMVPASLKAWIDLVARAGLTFRYTAEGPEGLMEGKRAILAVASGGTEVGSPGDFATPYMRHVLGFLGIEDVQIVASDRVMVDADASEARAEADLERLAA